MRMLLCTAIQHSTLLHTFKQTAFAPDPPDHQCMDEKLYVRPETDCQTEPLHTHPQFWLPPHGCVLSARLYVLYAYECCTTHQTNSILKYAEDTTRVGRDSVHEWGDKCSSWCSRQKNWFWTVNPPPPYTLINGQEADIVSTFKFLGTCSSADLSWSQNTKTQVKKAQQLLDLLHVLGKKNTRTRSCYWPFIARQWRASWLSFWMCGIQAPQLRTKTQC